MPYWRHRKTGYLYRIISTDAMLQCSTDQQFEDAHGKAPWTIYQNIDTNKVYMRLTKEFNDGRFAQQSV